MLKRLSANVAHPFQEGTLESSSVLLGIPTVIPRFSHGKTREEEGNLKIFSFHLHKKMAFFEFSARKNDEIFLSVRREFFPVTQYALNPTSLVTFSAVAITYIFVRYTKKHLLASAFHSYCTHIEYVIILFN